MREGRQLPPKIRDAPELQLGLELYYGAFMDLSSCRHMGMDEGPIPWIAIHTYCENYELDEDQRESMFYHIRSMDNAYLQFRAGKMKELKSRGAPKK